MKLAYPACFTKDPESDAYSVVVPDLPGCISWADNLAETILMGTEAASGWIITNLEKGRTIPLPSPLDTIKPDENNGSFVSILALDLDTYVAKYGKKPVKKSLDFEIPAWLDTFIDSEHINLSRLMLEALTEKHRQTYIQ
ncbi:MAG: type II toxin-antitoxin system HicB family antitoxin [Holophagaceae bacterium]|nr:type II toxin-antitoxin system HicB family antitoxin [Holophagaceae bacterium]